MRGKSIILCFILIFHLCIYPEMDKAAALAWFGLKIYDLIFLLMAITTLVTVISGCVYLVENRVRLREMLNDIYRIFVPSNI